MPPKLNPNISYVNVMVDIYLVKQLILAFLFSLWDTKVKKIKYIHLLPSQICNLQLEQYLSGGGEGGGTGYYLPHIFSSNLSVNQAPCQFEVQSVTREIEEESTFLLLDQNDKVSVAGKLSCSQKEYAYKASFIYV